MIDFESVCRAMGKLMHDCTNCQIKDICKDKFRCIYSQAMECEEIAQQAVSAGFIKEPAEEDGKK